MRLTHDHKVALYDRLAPHLSMLSVLLGRRVDLLGDGSLEGHAAAQAKQAVDVALVSAAAVAGRPDPDADRPGFIWSKRLGPVTLVTSWGQNGGAATLTCGTLAVCLGLNRLRRDRPGRLGASGELSGTRRGAAIDADMLLWRWTLWHHASYYWGRS